MTGKIDHKNVLVILKDAHSCIFTNSSLCHISMIYGYKILFDVNFFQRNLIVSSAGLLIPHPPI